MPRHSILILIICLLISCISTAQTQAQIDSIKNELLKVIKNSPPPPDSLFRRRYDRQEIPDTLHFSKVQEYKVQAFPPIFETAYFKAGKASQDSITIDFFAVDIGKINIESGKIIACDPIVMDAAKPFTQLFPVGQFPVQLSIAKFKGDERVAFSRIYFSDKAVVKWEFALDSGKKQIPLVGDEFYSYGVDGGIGLFIDAKANVAFFQLRKKDENLWDKVFTGEMDKHIHNTWRYVVYNFEKYNLASFTTGLGDGHYATYVGYDDKGRPCRLLTDFGLVAWWKKSN